MRKLAFILFIFVISIVSANAQEKLSFMGVPVDGQVVTFVEKLKAKGLTIEKKEDIAYKLKGKFAGTNVDEVYVFYTPKSHLVSKVVVYFPKETTWSDLKNNYLRLKKNYDIKYKSDKDYSFFLSPYDEGDGYEMTAVRVDKCRYAKFYTVGDDGIMIEITKYCQVKCVYENNKNTSQMTIEKESSIQDDI